MSNIDLTTANSIYIDVLREIGNVGAGNASTALSQMMNCKIDMSVPEVKLLDFCEVGEVLGGEEIIMAGVYLAIEGDINGSIMFLLNKDSAKKLVARLCGSDENSDALQLTEMEQSAIKEIGNIMTASYLNSIAVMTNLSVMPSVPSLCVDMAGAILSVPAIEFGITGDKFLLIKNNFFKGLEGYFILAPDMESLDKIFGAFGM